MSHPPTATAQETGQGQLLHQLVEVGDQPIAEAMRCSRGRQYKSGMNQRISSRVVSWIGHSAEEEVAMGRGGDEAVLTVVELQRGSLGLSVASRPPCPLTLQAPPLTPRRPRLRQTYQHHSAPGPAWITSVPSRPAGE